MKPIKLYGIVTIEHGLGILIDPISKELPFVEGFIDNTENLSQLSDIFGEPFRIKPSDWSLCLINSTEHYAVFLAKMGLPYDIEASQVTSSLQVAACVGLDSAFSPYHLYLMATDAMNSNAVFRLS